MESEKNAYWCLFTYFECCKLPILCRAVDLIDQKVIEKSYFEFAHDLHKSLKRQYAHYTDDEYTPIADFGHFFKHCIADPDFMF